jgi:glycosyltransferase involved in cell wall biosynthesis
MQYRSLDDRRGPAGDRECNGDSDRPPRRVLVVSNLDMSHPFGQSTRPYYLGRSLTAQGWEVGNVGIHCGGIDFGESWSTTGRSVRRFVSQIRAARRTFGPAVIYAHQNFPAVAAMIATTGSDIPVAADFHSLPSLEWRAIGRARSGEAEVGARVRYLKARAAERFIAQRCPMIIAAGQSLSATIADELSVKGRIAAVPNGIPRHFFEPIDGREDPFEGTPGRNVVATIPRGSSVANDEAIKFLGEVGRRLAEMDPTMTIHVIGADPQGPTLPLVFHGLVPDLRPWLASADACLLPYTSLYPLAGGARNKLLEYLALGRRIVTTSEGLRGLEEAAGWKGVTTTPDDPLEFARAVIDSTDGPAELPLLRPEMEEKLTWDLRGREVSDLLWQLVETHGG